MNTKASNVGPRTSASDLLKYAVAILIAAAGVAVYYLLPAWPAPVRALLVALGFAAAFGLVAMTTAIGAQGRDFFSESLFELRKVVWPTRQEATRITGVVLLVVVIISLIIAGFDFLISIAIKWLLSN